MSSLWGGLAGLGDSLNEVGMQMSKSALADKLEKQREARAEERQVAREARQEARDDMQVKTTDFITRDGALFKRNFNGKGNVLDESLASKDEIDKRNRDQVKADQAAQKADLEIDSLLADQAERPVLFDLKRRDAEASLANRGLQGQLYNAQAGYYNTRDRGGSRAGGGRGLAGAMGEDDGTMPSFGEGVRQLIDDNKAILDQYDVGDEDLVEIARESINAALKGNKDINDTFQRHLKLVSDRRKSTK